MPKRGRISFFGFVVSKSMSQLPDVRVSRPVRAAWQPPPSSSHPPRGRSAGAASEAAAATSEATTEQRPPTFDDYDADLELAWLGYVLAKCQPPAAHGDRNLVKQSIDHDLVSKNESHTAKK